MKLSVIICTRNPRPDRLEGLVRSLKAQTLPADRWEWLVVDNGSDPPVAGTAFPSLSRVVREEREGLTPARLCGIRETRGEVLVFLDDDNEPAPDYLERTLELFEGDPTIGVAGGRIDGRFETAPARAIRPYLGWLAVRPWVTRERAAGLGDAWGCLPCGAGLAIRRDPAQRYADAVEADPERLALDRTGGRLTGSGDTDLALTALDMGFRALLTPRLRLTHVIPASRLETAYLERLLEGSAYSTSRLARSRGLKGRPSWLNRLARRLKRVATAHPSDWAVRLRLERAIDRGEEQAKE